MKCSECHTELPDDAVFCHKCGASIEERENKLTRDTSGNKSKGNHLRDRLKSKATDGDEDDDIEEELWAGRYSTKSLIGAWFWFTLAAILLAIILISFSAPWGVWLWSVLCVFIVFACVWIYGQYLKWRSSYRLTTQRFVHCYGILNRVTDRLEVIDIDDITFEQRLLERLVGVGKIIITSSDRTHPELIICGIDDVKEVADVMDAARRKERIRRGLHIKAI